MKNIVATLVTTTTLGLLATVNYTQSAKAATLTYDLGDSNSTQLFFDYEPNGSSNPILIITAREENTPRRVRRRGDGLGIFGANDTNSLRRQIDGRNSDGDVSFESLLLNFEQRVRIESASFTRLQNNDGFRLFVDGEESPLVSRNRNLNSNNPFDFSSFSERDRTGNTFRFTVAQPNDDYRLQSVTVTPIYEKSSIVSLLSFGLVGLLFYRRYSKR